MKFILSFLLLTFSFSQKSVDKNYLLGRFDPSIESGFIQLNAVYAKGNALNRFLRKETFEAFKRMSEAAKKDGVKLIIVSATRNFDYQKKIWEDKWNGKVKVGNKDLTTIADFNERARLILLYSAMPGTSRHHWGTDIDINETETEYFETDEGKKVYQWLTAHANEYGFCQPYTSKANGRTGYEEEKWHWSYMPLSKILLAEYKNQIRFEEINGFAGSETANALRIIENYVDGIACR
ncbi:MAG: M15 family metallopeptidase [Bacteroidetes bacterium]|nr:M15 family metallopeptidase [Bacteroidota bacterium]MBI3482725.1 M15 family metallopeptidase [Bacteroidota bacterium]